MIYLLFQLKRMIEDLFIYPFILAGRQQASREPLETSYGIFLFFPFHHTGGAEKVHAQVAEALRGRSGVIIFTRKSHDDGFRKAFEASGHDVMDISRYTDDKRRFWNNLIWRGVISAHINNQFERPVVFNGQCNFAYKCAPWIRRDVAQYELIHSYNSFSLIRVPFIKFYRQTVMISRKAISEHLAQYRRFGIGERWSERITYIRNGISLPQDPVAKTFDGPVLRVLYAGRGGTEKRVHLVADIADACRSAGMPVQFTFMGDVRDALRPGQSDSGELLGNVTDQDRVAQVYRDSDILILTSSEEGFPMVVMEAMARGLVILATPVGDLPAHVHDGEAGYLFSSVTDEDRIRTEGVSRIAQLLSDRALCRRISQHNVEYARLHFGLDRFEESYRNLPDNQTH